MEVVSAELRKVTEMCAPGMAVLTVKQDRSTQAELVDARVLDVAGEDVVMTGLPAMLLLVVIPVAVLLDELLPPVS